MLGEMRVVRLLGRGTNSDTYLVRDQQSGRLMVLRALHADRFQSKTQNTQLLEGHGVSSETQFNFIVNELGAPGLVVWVALYVYMIAFIARGMRRVRDGNLAIMLAGTFAPFIAIFIEQFSGPTSASAAAGPYFWFVIGVAAYWFAGPGRMRLSAPRTASTLRPPALAGAR